MGAIYRIHFVRHNLKQALKALKDNGYSLMGAALGGEDLYQAKIPKKTALIMGSESHGIHKDISEQLEKLLLIPRFGKTESLNVAMATGIILSHYKMMNLK
jgi:TrmH family RNA methyltransferase